MLYTLSFVRFIQQDIKKTGQDQNAFSLNEIVWQLFNNENELY
jgi:hypothetical protein